MILKEQFNQGQPSNEYLQHLFSWRNKKSNFLDTSFSRQMTGGVFVVILGLFSPELVFHKNLCLRYTH